ncbi:MAG TPA: nitroreductase family protein [Clostridia bacterium]
MGFSLTDASKCTKCSICSAVCPIRILSIGENGPFLIPERQNHCLNCGQCEAYCPQNAVSVDFPAAKPFHINSAEKISPEQIGYHMANRRSIRKYSKNTVDKNVLEELMDIVRYAPTGSNAQHVGWIIVYDRQKINKILDTGLEWLHGKLGTEGFPIYLNTAVDAWKKGVDIICLDAPHLAVAYSPSTRLGPTDAAIAATYLELAAPAFGLGTCWGGLFMILAAGCSELLELLEVPEGNFVSAALMLGYPEITSKRIPKRNNGNVKWL